MCWGGYWRNESVFLPSMVRIQAVGEAIGLVPIICLLTSRGRAGLARGHVKCPGGGAWVHYAAPPSGKLGSSLVINFPSRKGTFLHQEKNECNQSGWLILCFEISWMRGSV